MKGGSREIIIRKNIWRWLFWLLAAALIWFFLGKQLDLENMAQIFLQGRAIFMILAFGLQIANHSLRAVLFQQAFSAVKVRSHFRDLFPAVFSALFMNMVPSSGGAGGFIYLVNDAKKRGQSAAGATAGALLIITTDFIAITLVSGIGLVYLFTKNNLQAYEIIAAIILIVITAILTSVMVLVFRWPEQLRSTLKFIQVMVNRTLKLLRSKLMVTDSWVDQHIHEFIISAKAAMNDQNRSLELIGLSLAAHTINLICFYTLFIAFNQPIGFGPLVAAYAMSILFATVSPTPQGLGIVEGIVPLVLAPLGVPLSKATVVVLAFRGLSIWLPLLAGFLIMVGSKLKVIFKP